MQFNKKSLYRYKEGSLAIIFLKFTKTHFKSIQEVVTSDYFICVNVTSY